VLVVDPARAGALADLLGEAGETVFALGRIEAGQGVRYTGALA
jgi:phosphoribosylformylglycinamidine cyclo-ligase